jgi:hypothetical protein
MIQHRVMVGCVDLFWTSSGVIFLGLPDMPRFQHGTAIMDDFLPV